MSIQVRFNKVFAPSHTTRARYVLLMGGAGSGKSTDTAQFYILRLMSQRGRNLLALRKSQVSCRDSQCAELLAAISRMGVGEYWERSENPLSLRCSNGNRILFRGMHDEGQREKIKSVSFETGNLTDIWMEEMSEFSPDDLEILDDRLRGQLPEGLFYQIRGTFNPVAHARWIKRRFFDRVDPEVFTLKTTFADNAFIDSAYRARMERRRDTDPEGYTVYAMGEWGGHKGLILNNWRVESISQEPWAYDCAFIGQDFGFNHANVLLLTAMRGDTLYILRELYLQGLVTEEIIERAGDFPKRLPMYCDSAEPDRIRQWSRAGFGARPVKKEPGSVGAQIQFLQGRTIVVHPSCIHTIEEMENWSWEPDGDGFLDVPAPGRDDCMAALRYSVESLRRGPAFSFA